MTETPETPESTEPEAPKTSARAAAPRPTDARPTAAQKRAAAVAAQEASAAVTGAAAAPTVSMDAPADTAASFTAPAAAAPGASFVRPKAKRSVSMPVAAAFVAVALLGGASGAGVTLWAVSSNDSDKVTTSSSPTTVTIGDTSSITNITAVALKASASVVTLSVSSDTGAGTGSGVVLSADGYILTNTHVVTLAGAASDPRIKVETNDGRLLDATLVGTDPIADLAVIKVTGVTDMVPAEFADSSALNVGDAAIAIGAPLGLAGTVTDGIVSSLNRSIQIASAAAPDSTDTGDGSDSGGDTGGTPDPNDFWQFDLPGQESTTTSSSTTISLAVIQTDAAINPGNSGGALLDSEGRVIGINVAIASAGSSSGESGSIGVGFAIPSNYAKRIATEIIATGTATHGLLGASVLDVTEDADASDSATVGASVKEVTAGGAAAKAGMKAGDVITAFNGVRITGKNDITAQVRAAAAGSEATVTYVRNGESTQVSVTLGSLGS